MSAKEWFKDLQKKAKFDAERLPYPDFAKVDYRGWQVDLKRPIQTEPNFVVQENSEAKEKGVIICPWDEALEKYGDLVQKYFGKAVPIDENRLVAEHVAQMEQGLLVYVPPKTILSTPIAVTFLQNAEKRQDYVQHVLIVAGENSEFSYLEKVESQGEEESLASLVVEVCALAGAKVKYAGIDRLGPKTTAYLKRVAWLGQDAQVDWAMGMLSDGKILGDYDSNLYGQGAKTQMNVIAITIGDQVQGLNTVVNNYGRKSDGRILQHGVILQKSKLVFNGIGHVMKGAKGANAQQENRVLMLSRKARGDANPILLIDDNDVFAGHAASVGRVDEQQLYYLMSRGIAKPVAERLVIRGFLGPVLTKIPDEAVRQDLFAMVERKLIDGQELD
ncbi:Fe-S cluster assembly protein SufD [Lactobacillus equicursoris]|uniref:Fe-S cluster assembly protein SufD n=1 Tax=Lactobacillus equicursoris TaxID=420645 RepID=UPI00243221E0|nr:Fe-S cluster assembly protein SufD [Lactobacillus equicursoris]MDD6386803.1 Fe-S cluster assembly protein SufD [Lactobacillus equicursoris]